MALLPHNTPLPSSDRMIYLLARVIEDMETGKYQHERSPNSSVLPPLTHY